MNYYFHNIGDYRRDTTHLSLLEHGLYRQLLDTYYLDEQPICANHTKLIRSYNVRTEDEQQALTNVLNDFFLLTENGYIHTRCDSEILKFHQKSDKARSSVAVRWANKTKGTDTNVIRKQYKRNTKALLETYEGNTNQEPITNIKPPIPPSSKFDEFWNLWPQSKRKVGKVACLKKWKASGLDAIAPKILSSVQALKTSEQWVTGFEPAPMTYINQQRWEDGVGATTPMRRAIVGVSPVKLREFVENTNHSERSGIDFDDD